MAATIKKAVRRKTCDTVRNGGPARALIVTLYPGDIIGLRELGRSKKSEECIALSSVYFYAIRCRVAKQNMDKGKQKIARKKGR